MQPDGTELSEAIAAVRAGLVAARGTGAGSEVRFVPDWDLSGRSSRGRVTVTGQRW